MEENFCNNCQRHISVANFATHSAFCERNIKVCKMCNEPIPISEEKEHLEEYHITVPCDLCGTLLEKWMLPEHQESCIKRKVTCKYCEGEVPFEKFPDHLEFCSSRTEKCTLCQKYIMLKDKEKHYEIHLCEKKISHANIDKEIKQNIINEVISNSSEQDIEEKVIATTIFSSGAIVNKNETFPQSSISNESTSVLSRSKEVDTAKSSSIIEDNNLASKNETHIRVPTGASACAPDLPNEMSKRYGTCYICKQTIPWIDMNTHIPSCASDAGKCSRCGEEVPNHEIKEHVLKNCKVLLREGAADSKTDLKRDKISRDETFYEDIYNQDMQQCPYCKQACSVDRIIEHMESCSESFYECPYCNLKIPKNDKWRHEAFECHVLIEAQGINLLTAHSTSVPARNSPEKYKYTTNIHMNWKSKPMKENSTDKSCADASRKLPVQNKNASNCKSCCPCNKKSPYKKQEHSCTCQKNEKGACFYCFEEIDALKEDIHLSSCKKFTGGDKSKTETQTNYKGAIPKCSNFADMVKPHIIECKFCKRSFNAELMFHHETECLDQPFTCEECDDPFPLRSLEDHRCKMKRGRGKRGKQEAEVKAGPKFSLLSGLFHKSRSTGEHDSNRFAPIYPPDPFGDAIPCEFCEELFPASEIVVHQTGCAPELVALPKKDSHEVESKKPAQNDVQENSILQERFFPSETETLYIRSGERKKHMESNVKPGEFLQSLLGDRQTSEISKDLDIRPLVYPSNSSIHSVWNNSSCDIKYGDAKTLFHASILDKEKENEASGDAQKQFEEEEIFNSDDEMAEMLEFINENETNEASKETSYSKSSELHRKYAKENASYKTSDHNLNSQRFHEAVTQNYNEPSSVKRIGEESKHSVGDNQDVKMQHTPQQSESETCSAVDLEKWTKWRSRESSNSN